MIYEIRKVFLTHCCTGDERTNYQRLATTSVIGDLMRSKYLGSGRRPRPNDIMATMRNDHNFKFCIGKHVVLKRLPWSTQKELLASLTLNSHPTFSN